MITNEAIADALDKAADLYESEKYEWCAGDYFFMGASGRISVCASQALRVACGERLVQLEDGDLALVGDVGAIFPLLKACINAVGFPHEGHLISWNDGKTTEDSFPVGKQAVIDRFKDAAKNLRNQS